MVYHPEDFGEIIKDMTDEALVRLTVVQENGLMSIDPGLVDGKTDTHTVAHFLQNLTRDTEGRVTEYDEVIRSKIATVHGDLATRTMPNFQLHIFASAVVSLAEKAAYVGHGSDVEVPTRESAEKMIIDTRLIENEATLHNRGRIVLASYLLASLGLTSVVFRPVSEDNCAADDSWELIYEARRRQNLNRF